MSQIGWQSIHDNFQNFLEDSSTGIGSLTSVTNAFRESDYIDIRSEPASIINGSYSLQLDNINAFNQDIGTGIIDIPYDIRLQIAFELNTRSAKDDYNNAVNDLEEIIRHRLRVTTWQSGGTNQSPGIQNIEFRNGSRLTTFESEALERFSFAELVFTVTYRTNLNS